MLLVKICFILQKKSQLQTKFLYPSNICSHHIVIGFLGTFQSIWPKNTSNKVKAQFTNPAIGRAQYSQRNPVELVLIAPEFRQVLSSPYKRRRIRYTD